MEKTLIRVSNTSATGYELVTINEKGKEQVCLLNDRPKNEPYTLILPANPSNRKYFNSKKVDAAGGQVELTYKATITLGERTSTGERKTLIDYLSDEDKATYLALIEKAKANKAEATKKVPLTPLEKARREVERMQAKYEALLAAEKASKKATK